MRVKILLIAAGILLLVAASLPAKSTLFTLIYDMFNQISIKPQEQGGMSEFVIGAVSIDGSEIEDPNDRFSRIIEDVISETATINPIKPDAASHGAMRSLMN